MSVQFDPTTGELTLRDDFGGVCKYTLAGWLNEQARVTGLLIEQARKARPKLRASSDFGDEATPVMTPGARTRVGKRPT